MAKIKFIRGGWYRYSKLGRKRRKKLVWRKARGRHNKMRKKRKGHPSIVSIGYKRNRKSNVIKIIRNLKELVNTPKGEEVILGKIGGRKRTEIIKKADELGIKIKNLKVNSIKKNGGE
ncbi:MAG: eL32 family ribosomal protein [Candidatus Pacearchaeota archaeon]